MSFTFAQKGNNQTPLDFLYDFSLPCLECRQCCIFGKEGDSASAYPLEELEEITGIPRRYLPDFFPFADPHKLLFFSRCIHLTPEKTCNIHSTRPLLCALFPFQIHTAHKNRYSIGISGLCPYAENIHRLLRKKDPSIILFLEELKNNLPLLDNYDLIFDFMPYRFRSLIEENTYK